VETTTTHGCQRQTGTRSSLPFSALKQRQLLFLLTRQLAEAQFARGDRALSERLWQEAAALELDPDRIVNLLYGVDDHRDQEALERLDEHYLHTLSGEARQERRTWWASSPFPGFRGKGPSVWHRSAPAAGLPAHP
jgi:hypothetical protein